MPLPQNHLTLIQGGKNADDLIAAMLQALKLADACGSQTTYDLLRMALLNEGVQLAEQMSECPTR
jgi:hypothetical protein